MNNEKVLLITPRQLQELNIGFPVTDFDEDEYDYQFPILYDVLVDLATKKYVGESSDPNNEVDVENSTCKICMCIRIKGKLHELKVDEWQTINTAEGLVLEHQVPIFQRLIHSKQTTLEELAAEDIDTGVYKDLVINDLEGEAILKEKLILLENLWAKQCESTTTQDKLHRMLKNL